MKKWTAGLVALAIAVGALPTLVTPAAAYEEKGKGQHFIRHRTAAIIIGATATVAVIAAVIVASSNKRTAPTSP